MKRLILAGITAGLVVGCGVRSHVIEKPEQFTEVGQGVGGQSIRLYESGRCSQLMAPAGSATTWEVKFPNDLCTALEQAQAAKRSVAASMPVVAPTPAPAKVEPPK